MEYPFFTDKVYFSGPEERHLKEFLAQEPQPGKIYTNDKGEKRLVMDVILPMGIITSLTAFAPGGQFYHTPTAKWDGEVAQVDYENVDADGGGRATSKEWLKWTGGAVKIDEPKPQVKSAGAIAMDAHVAAQKKAIGAGREPVKTDFNDLETGWHSPTDNQKVIHKPENVPKKKRGRPSKKGL